MSWNKSEVTTGRKREIDGTPFRATYNITEDQAEWIAARAEELGLTASRYMRLLISKAMQMSGGK